MADENIHSDDELFEQLEAELEQDGTFNYYRDQRISQIQNTVKQHENLSTKFSYFDNEKEFLKESHRIPRGNYVVLFVDDSFLACQILLTAMKSVVQYGNGNFSVCVLKASNSPFLVEKLNIKTLPTYLAYRNHKQIAVHIGLEGLLEDIKDVHSLEESRLEVLFQKYYPINKDENDSD